MGPTPASVDCSKLLLHLMGPSMVEVSTYPPVTTLCLPGPRNSGDSLAPLKIWVDFVGSNGLESYHIAGTEVHLISDLKKLFERQMGIDLYPSVRKLLASQDGILTLTDAIWLKDLNPDRPVSLILVEQQEEATLSGSAVPAAFDENLSDEIPTGGCGFSWDHSNSYWSDIYEGTGMSNVILNEEGVFDPENEPGVTSPARSKTDTPPEVSFSAKKKQGRRSISVNSVLLCLWSPCA